MALKALQPGAPFLFKLHRDDRVVGGGFFADWTHYPVSIAWEAFGQKNGVASLQQMRARIERYRRLKPAPHEDYEIGCILLEQPFLLDDGDRVRIPDWQPNIVRGKGYALAEEPGHSLWSEVSMRLQARGLGAPGDVAEPPPRYGEPQLVRPRLGQGSFRLLVRDAYARRCAATGEKVLPVLEAAHIHSRSTCSITGSPRKRRASAHRPRVRGHHPPLHRRARAREDAPVQAHADPHRALARRTATPARSRREDRPQRLGGPAQRIAPSMPLAAPRLRPDARRRAAAPGEVPRAQTELDRSAPHPRRLRRPCAPRDRRAGDRRWIRRGEVLGLKWSDVDLDAAEARIERQLVRHRGSSAFAPPKTDRSRRVVALPTWCITILREHRKRQIAARMRAGAKWIEQDLVFTNRCGGPTNPAEVSYEFTKHLKDAGLPHVRFHDLRHGFASMLLSDGEDLGVISDMMGHSTIAITKDLYAESSREAKRRAVARLDGLLG